MLTGSVARFDARRGYGFLVPDDGGEDVFVHQNNIEMEGFRYLNPGERVGFEVEAGERGRKAVGVTLLEERQERPRREAREPREERPNGRGNGRSGGDRPARNERAPRATQQRGGGDSEAVVTLQKTVDKLRRKQERLLNLLVEKEILAPGEIDELPGLDAVTSPTVLSPETLAEEVADLDADDFDDDDEDL